MVTHNGNEFVIVNRLGNQITHVLDRKSAFDKLFELGENDHDVKPIYRDKKYKPVIFTKSEVKDVVGAK